MLDKSNEIIAKTQPNLNRESSKLASENLVNPPSPESPKKRDKRTQPIIYPEIDYVNRTLP